MVERVYTCLWFYTCKPEILWLSWSAILKYMAQMEQVFVVLPLGSQWRVYKLHQVYPGDAGNSGDVKYWNWLG